MGLKQPIWAGLPLLAGNFTVFSPAFGFATDGTVTVENQMVAIASTSGTIRNLRCLLTVAPGGSGSRVFTLRHNGGNTSVAVTCGASDTDVSNTSDTVSVSAGDTLVWRMVSSGSPVAARAYLVYEFETGDNYTSIYGFGGMNSLGTGTTAIYASLFGSFLDWPTAAGTADTVVGTPGTVTGYRVRLNTAPGTSKTREFLWTVNGVLQDGTGGTPNTLIAISDAATSGSATFSLPLSQGDIVRLRALNTATSTTNSLCQGTHTFVADDAHAMVFSGAAANAVGAAATHYCGPVSLTSWNATESARELPAPITGISLSGLYATTVVAPGSAQSVTITLRKNQTDTGHVAVVSGTNTTSGSPSAGAVVDLGAPDVFSLKGVGTSTTSGFAHTRIIFMTSAPAPPGTGFNALLVAP